MEERNIPVLPIGRAVKQLTKLYVEAIRQGTPPLSRLISVMLWGPPGVGKSEGVEEIAQQVEQETKKRVLVTEVRLQLMNPVDLHGLPVADAGRNFAKWLKPQIFALDPSPDAVNILFLDELSAAPPAMQAAAYQLVLNRAVGEHRLPENCLILAAGNRTTDRSVAYRMPNALANRMLHLEICPDFDDWKAWALRRGIHPLVLGYLAYDNRKLYQEEIELDEVAFPTPRSWAAVSALLFLQKEARPDELHPLISGCIGVGTAVEFEAWCQSAGMLGPVEEIFQGKKPSCPKNPDLLYTQISSMLAYLRARRETVTGTQLEAACRYLRQIPPDFAMLFFREAMEIEGMNLKLMHSDSFRNWMQDNRKYLP